MRVYFDVLHVQIFIQQNILGAQHFSENQQKRWQWLATFFKNAGGERVKLPLMSVMDQINPPWQTANIFVLFNAFETLCFPQSITDMSQVYSPSANVRKSCKYFHFAVRSGRGLHE